MHVVRWKGVWLGKAQYLPSSFTRRLLHDRKIYIDVGCWMWCSTIYNTIFGIKCSYYGYVLAAYWCLQLSAVEVFIPSDGQMTTVKEFIIHHLVLDLNHQDRECNDFRSKNSLTFSQWTESLRWYDISLLFVQ